MIGQSVLKQLFIEIKSSYWFAILAAEATDVFHHEQMSLSIHWVNSTFVIHDVHGLIQLPDTKQ